MPPIPSGEPEPTRLPQAVNLEPDLPPTSDPGCDPRSNHSTYPGSAPPPADPTPVSATSTVPHSDLGRPERPGESRTDVIPRKIVISGSTTIPGYELVATIGRGAMGVVYQARQTSLNRTVALKVLTAGAHATDADRARFRTEAQSVAQVQHPNVIQVYDVGEHEGIPYLAVEYVPGGNLQQWLGGKPMSVQGAIRLLYAVARGVGAAHARGVVHRDLKPANILLTADGVPKVADFGLAKQAGATNYTATGSLIGTPAYMSPEQAGGLTKRIGPASDVYSLGVILYQCLAGRVPFACESVLQLLEQIRFVEPVPVREWRREVPEEVEAVLRRCLHKAPEERYPTAGALADDLARILARWEAERLRGEVNAAPPRKGGSPLLAVATLVLALLLWGVFAWRSGWLPGFSKGDPATPPADAPSSGYPVATP